MRVIIYLVITLLSISCKKSINTKNVVTESVGWKELWRSPLHTDSSLTRSIKPILADNNVVFSNVWNRGNDQFILIDGESGDRLGVWDDYLFPTSALFDQEVQVFNDKVMITSQYTISCFSFHTMNSVWKYEFSKGNSTGISDLCGDKLYSCIYFDGSYPHKRAAILSSEVYSPSFDTVLLLKIRDNYSPFAYSIKEVEKSNGEKILIYKNREYNYSINNERFSLECFSMNQDSIIWVNNSFNESSGILDLLVHDNKIICPGGTSIWCLDLNTGQTLWQYDHSKMSNYADYSFGGVIILDDKVIAKGMDEAIVALDVNNGNVLWANTKTGNLDFGTIIEFEGKIYFCGTGYLYVLDGTTGEIIHKEGSPTKYRHFVSSPTIDPDRRVIYVADEVFAYCLKLPDFN